MASALPAAHAQAILHAPDLASAERAYLQLMPDLAHVSELAQYAARLPRAAGAAPGYTLSMTLVGLRLQELEMDEPRAAQQRRDSQRSLRQAYASL
ncbi:MAG: hypothetical protein GAK31_01852 [Stenotrophomonas maltophilia]|uniref:Uncharacterized protein n=1 Tax=Stenotrophomonas maltophilia TaxID=40324 RepID=A0A7V8FIJ8_STEMA|nr:MAG: hypothetical protein GAK31_01852 [Stenotrophomonas maltophilia]